MKANKELMIFKKPSISYLKKMYARSVNYVFDKNNWKSTSPDTFGESRILLHTRKSLKKLGRDMKIFKAPTIEGMKIIYYKNMGFIFDKFKLEHELASSSEVNYLLRDLSSSADYLSDKCENELKIFKLPSIEILELLYYKNINNK